MDFQRKTFVSLYDTLNGVVESYVAGVPPIGSSKEIIPHIGPQIYSRDDAPALMHL